MEAGGVEVRRLASLMSVHVRAGETTCSESGPDSTRRCSFGLLLTFGRQSVVEGDGLEVELPRELVEAWRLFVRPPMPRREGV